MAAAPPAVIDRLYRELFCRQLGLAGTPVVQLAEIVHWSMVMRGLGLADLPLARARAYVAAGYFYAVHTPAPSADEVDATLACASEHGACALYPAVRRSADVSALEAAGFTALPWFLEAEYHVREGVDDDLRAQLGGKRHRELRRLERRCDEALETRMLVGRELAEEPAALAQFERLHWLNLSKYGHAHSQYEADGLARMLASPLGAQLFLLLRRPRSGGPPVQALLGLLESERGRLVVPVHGIDHGRVPAGHNLYLTGCSWLYRWGVERGIECFDLGRGAERAKLDLGANAFHLLDNHLAVAGAGTLDGLDELAAACDARIAAGLRSVEETAERRGAAALTDLPALEHQTASL